MCKELSGVAQASGDAKPLPLKGWALDLARRWNSGAYSLFVLSGNIFDLFPVNGTDGVIRYLQLKAFLNQRVFSRRFLSLFYDIEGGVTFGSHQMREDFFKLLPQDESAWMYGLVESRMGSPESFAKFLNLASTAAKNTTRRSGGDRSGVTVIVDYPEKLIPNCEDSSLDNAERQAIVSLLKFATSQEAKAYDIGALLVTESVADLHDDICRNPYVAQVVIGLPDESERLAFLKSEWLVSQFASLGGIFADCDLTPEELAKRTSGLSLVRIQNLIAEAMQNAIRITSEYVSNSKKRLIEEYCQGLVKFKEPKPGVSLDSVATHSAAKKKFRELAWLIKNGKGSVLEKGILLPGRIGVGKSFLIDCFASECGLPVMELGDFRSKWVGDTEQRQSRILLTIAALGPVVVVVDEADAAFGGRSSDTDGGVSTRVFGAFAAHIGDPSIRGKELWVAMTSRPDLLAIDMKRQGRFGLCIPLFAAQDAADVLELFDAVTKTRRVPVTEAVKRFIRRNLGSKALTGSDVESIVIRAEERATLARRDGQVSVEDIQEAVESFIDPLDPSLIYLQVLAAILACSDKRYLPLQYANADRARLTEDFLSIKSKLRMLGP